MAVGPRAGFRGLASYVVRLFARLIAVSVNPEVAPADLLKDTYGNLCRKSVYPTC